VLLLIMGTVACNGTFTKDDKIVSIATLFLHFFKHNGTKRQKALLRQNQCTDCSTIKL
jgi:hypothetical protein